MNIPLDTDGFLRRECPTCEREFKVYAGAEDGGEEVPPPPGGYCCPYCAIQAPPDAWWTKTQLEAAQSLAVQEFVAPELERFAKSVGGRVEMKSVDEPPELSERDDMRRVDVPCHPDEPIKVLDDWGKPVHCFICGTLA